MGKPYTSRKVQPTCNVYLWIKRDESLYKKVCEYAQSQKNKGEPTTYKGFVLYAGLENLKTPDGISFTDMRLKHDMLDGLIADTIG